MRRVCPLLVLLAAVSAPSRAQETLTLDGVLRDALAQNAGLRAARAGSAEAAAHATAARSAFFPRVSFTESWQRGDQPVFVFSSLLSSRRFAAANFAIDTLNNPGAIGFFHTTVGAEQLVFDGGRQRSAAAAAALRRDIAALTVDEAAAGLVLSATQAFGRVIAAQAAHAAATAAAAAAREDLARIERRREAGMATDADVLALAVHLAELQQREIQAAGDRAIARAELNRLAGSPVDRAFVAVEPASDPAERSDVGALLAESAAKRPELRRAAAMERLAGAARREARAALLPQVNAHAALDVGGTRFDDRAGSWLIGGELRWTFSTGGAERARMQAAAHAASRARAEHEDLRAAVHVDVISAVQRVESARARQIAGRAAVDQARERQRIVRDRFDAGLAAVSDVLRASSALLDAEANRVSAVVDSIVGEAMLRRAVGRTP